MTLFRFGRLLQGLAIPIWASDNISIVWNPVKLALLIFVVIIGVSVITGLIIMYMEYWYRALIKQWY